MSPTGRTVAKAGLSEPTVGCRTAGDQRIKATLGITSDSDIISEKKSCCPTHSVRVGMPRKRVKLSAGQVRLITVKSSRSFVKQNYDWVTPWEVARLNFFKILAG